MADVVPENEALAKACETVAETATAAIAWIGEAGDLVREEAPAMVRDFRREAIRARKLAAAARRPMCVSVFGPSQQGKSYLIASLARKDKNPAMIRFGEELRGFNRDINPDGGKESTGLVTRFSIRPIVGLPGMPVACRMLSQTDIVKIMANAFMEDFDRDTVVQLEPDVIDAALAKARGKAAAAPVDRLTEDDVYDLYEYFERYFRNHPCHVALKPGSWREIEALAPRLAVADRVELFGLLWNQTPTMTRVATKLVTALAALDHPAEAFAPMAALEPKAKSIIDVETMHGLDKDDGDRIPVATSEGRRAEIGRAVLTAIVAELQLQLADKPFDFFDHTDLLDFPGARSREKYNAARAEATAAENLFMLFRRGKVAYLYQRYLAEQELTSMLLCLKDSNQEVRSVPSMVKDWVDATHGATPQARQGQDTALFLVLTMFDKEFVTKGGVSGDTVEHWSIRFDTTIKQYLALDHDWPREWTPGKAFNNAFWLRNPEVFDKGLLDYDDARRELAFREPERLAKLRANFLQNADVQAHFADPGLAWDAAMKLNDGGIGLIAERLGPVCNPALKRRQVQAQLKDLAARLAQRLEPYHVSADLDAELQKRRAEARKAGRQLLACAEAQAFGLMLRALQVEPETLADLFRRQTLEGASGPAAVVAPVGARVASKSLRDDFEALFDGDPATPDSVPAPAETGPRDTADLLASAAVVEWIEGMHRFAARADTPELFRIDHENAAVITAQLAAASRRLKLRETIAERMRMGAGYHERLTDRMIKPVMIAERAINDFVAWLGFDMKTEADRPKAGRDQHPVFKRGPAAETLPALSETPLAYDAAYYLDWATAFVRLVEDNVRESGGATVDIAANARLGQMLARLRSGS
jgi:hypothetical protein